MVRTVPESGGRTREQASNRSIKGRVATAELSKIQFGGMPKMEYPPVGWVCPQHPQLPLRRPPPPPRAYLGCLRNRWLPRAAPLAAQLRMRPRKKQYRKPLLGESIGESIHRDIIRESIHPVRRGALGIAHELARAAASDDTIRRGAPLLRVL